MTISTVTSARFSIKSPSEDVLYPLDVVHDPGLELSPQLQLPLSQSFRERPHQHRHPDAGRCEEGYRYESHRGVEGVEDEGGERADGERHGHGGEGAQVDILQLLDVLYDAGEEITTAVVQ